MGQRHPLTIGITIANEDLRDEVRGALRDQGVRILLEQDTPIESLQLKRLSPDLLLIEDTPAFQPFTSRLPPDLVLARTGNYYEIRAQSP